MFPHAMLRAGSASAGFGSDATAPYRKQERGLRSRAPLAPENGEAATGHPTMDVRVQRQGLSPGVQHAQTSGLNLQTAAGDIDERSASGTEKQVVEDTRCVQSEDVEDLGHGEDHMKVGHGKKLGPSSLEPSRASSSAASWTRSVAAGVPLDVLVAAAITLLPVPAEGGRAARADRTQGLALRSRGSAAAQKGLASSSYDRAEVMLGGQRLTRAGSLWRPSGPLERTGHVAQRRGRHVRVGLGRMNVCMAEQHLHHTRARALLDQVRGIAMT